MKDWRERRSSMLEQKKIGGHACYFHGDQKAKNVLLQPVDDHDLIFLDSEFSLIEQSAAEPLLLAAFQVEHWNHDLSPWEARPSLGRMDSETEQRRPCVLFWTI